MEVSQEIGPTNKIHFTTLYSQTHSSVLLLSMHAPTLGLVARQQLSRLVQALSSMLLALAFQPQHEQV
jgi:hypothetical protein